MKNLIKKSIRTTQRRMAAWNQRHDYLMRHPAEHRRVMAEQWWASAIRIGAERRV